VSRLVLLLLTLLLGACASAPGRLEANRFQHEVYPYSLFYAETGSAEYPLGAHYTVENFESRDGRHRYARLGPEFTIDRSYRDESPAMVGREPFYDLLLARDQPWARFWLRSVPLAKAERDTPLLTLAQRYVDAAAESGRATPPFGLEEPLKVATRVELREVKTRSCELSKRDAVRLDFALQNPEAAHRLNEPEWLYVSLVIIGTGYYARTHYPVLLLAGRTAAAAHDETLDRDFERVLDRLVLGDKGQGLSMKGGHTCGANAAESSGGAVTPAAPGREGSTPSAAGGELRGPALEVPIIEEDASAPAVR
jgi:hypothetical protein